MRILCIDDDKTFLTMFQKVLEKHALPDDEIITSRVPEEALKLAKEKPVDVIITDLVMPEKTGIDVLREAKEINPATEVIVVTGQGSIDSAVEAMQLGARDYLTKPLNHDMLLQKIQNIRELIDRVHEAEEYRYAKETIENNASEAVAEMEIKLDQYITLIDDIKQAATDTINSDEKIEKILSQINTIEKDV